MQSKERTKSSPTSKDSQHKRTVSPHCCFADSCTAFQGLQLPAALASGGSWAPATCGIPAVPGFCSQTDLEKLSPLNFQARNGCSEYARANQNATGQREMYQCQGPINTTAIDFIDINHGPFLGWNWQAPKKKSQCVFITSSWS